jgi:hypothetical protein
MKRLTWFGIGLALVAQATFVPQLSAQSIALPAASPTTVLGRHTLTAAITITPSALADFDPALVLSSMVHLPALLDTSITTSAVEVPTLRYLPLSTAATTANIDPYLTVSLGRLNSAPPPAIRSASVSVLATPTPIHAAMVSSPSPAAVTGNWRLGSRNLPTSGSPVVTPPTSGSSGSGDLSGLGRGTLTLGNGGGSISTVGVPEPSTYLLCGLIAVLGGYWFLRRQPKPSTASDNVDLTTMAMGENGEALSA